MYANIKDAWIVLMLDNTPHHMPADIGWGRVQAKLAEEFTDADLASVDAEIGALRQPNDIDDIDSPLWNVCAGEDAADRVTAETNEMLEWLFELDLAGEG